MRLPRRRVPRRRAFAGRGARRHAGRDRGERPELPSRWSTPSAPAPRRSQRTSRSRSAACPTGIKELEPVEGWPYTEASLVFKDRKAEYTATVVERLVGQRRRGSGRPDDRERVRRPQRQRHEAQRRHPQPVAARAHGRRLVGRLRGRGRRWARLARDRRRRRRIDPHPGRLHRPARHEGHVRTDPPRTARVHAPEHRRARQPRALGARRGALLRRVRRLPPCGSDEPAEAPGLRSRARHATSLAGKRVAVDPEPRRRSARRRRRGAPAGRGRRADRRDRDGAGRPRRRSAEPGRAVDDGQPRRRCSPTSGTSGPAARPT